MGVKPNCCRTWVVLLSALCIAGACFGSPAYVPIAGLQLPPENPAGGLVSDGAGNFWGTTSFGGGSGAGTVFKVNQSTGSTATEVQFNPTVTSGSNRGSSPRAALVSDGAGNLWGTTISGGANGDGTVFEINPGTGAFETVEDFTATASGSSRGSEPYGGLVSDGAGNLWGTSFLGGAYGLGTVFEINTSTGAMVTVEDFAAVTSGSNRGGEPFSGLVSDGTGNLWGTTYGGGANGSGTVFKVNSSTRALATVVDFTSSTTGTSRGANPEASLVSDGAGNLWGTTYNGGANSAGTVFKINVATGAIATVVDFTASTTGTSRGANPQASLVSDGAGNLWGTTYDGGASNRGTIFKINTSSGAITTVADVADGSPEAGLVSDGAGNLWGTTYGGAVSVNGTVFKINVSTGTASTVVAFSNVTAGANRGNTPQAGLASDAAGNLWGTTYYGGANGVGTVYELNLSSPTPVTIVDFTAGTTGSNRGGYPYSALVSDTAGNLWGTTNRGGAFGAGTVYKINPSSGAMSTVVDFAATTTGSNRGSDPFGGLVSDGVGNLWGTTYFGGVFSAGTVYRVNTSSGAIATMVDFTANTTGSNRGGFPYAGMASDGAGNLWGTTYYGGANGYGTVYQINAGTGALATVEDFTAAATGSNRGGYPYAGLASDGTGDLWGMTSIGGTAGNGTVFEINASTGAMTTVVDFTSDYATAGRSRGGLTSDGAGNLWGADPNDGPDNDGVVYNINEGTGEITTVFDFTGGSTDVPGANPEGALFLTGSALYGTTQAGGVTASGDPSGGGEIFLVALGPAIEAGSIMQSGAILSGTANPNGVDTTYYFQYGTTPQFGRQTDAVDMGSGLTPVSVSGTVTNTAGGATYYYQLVLSNSTGTYYGPTMTFTTPGIRVPAMPPWGPVVLAVGMGALGWWGVGRRAARGI